MPATQNFVLAKGYPCSAAITKKKAVKFTGDQTVGPVTGAGDNPCGVALFSVSSAEILKGKKASVMTEGRVVMEADGAITIGSKVYLAADGRASATATSATLIGICDEPALADGNECSVHLWAGSGA